MAARKSKRVTSTQIAHLAGVSRSTVSRVVNGYGNVPESTMESVTKVINQYGYYPSFSGRVLAGKHTDMLALIWISSGDNIAYDALASAFMVHAIESAADHGYYVLNCLVPNLTDKANIDKVKRLFLQRQVDGGIMIGASNREPVVEELMEQGVVLGLMDYSLGKQTPANCISVNFEMDTGEKAIDYVYGMGHRTIGIIDGDMNRYSSACRHEGYIRGMRKYRLEFRSEWMKYGGIVQQGGYHAAKELLQGSAELPTVICANNDAVAFGVYQALQEASIRIPEDISVVGIDGHTNARTLNPPLTTFAFDFSHMFDSLVSRTIQVATQGDAVPQSEYITSTLIERASCKRIEP